ncbi:MAG: 4a-hydroxytetrahydrobiopterin dehydratase [Chloroflexi bacterium]|nr:MAG: 4a-hydroxytetrahydrobiopterin dehydratase [Chloroflexota bacterium]
MSTLAAERCEACTGSTPTVTGDELERLHGELAEGWSVVGGTRLRRELRFSDFNSAFGLATRVALLAEAEGHHPDMTVGWGRLEIELTTHAVGGLSRNDFVIAAKVDRMVDPR